MVAIPCDYGQPSASTGAISPELLRSLFQWSDEEGEANDYASSVTVSSVQTGFALVSMADNNSGDDLCHRMEAHEQTSKAAGSIG